MGIIEFIKSVCVQKAVFWEAEATGFGGIGYKAPVSLDPDEGTGVRWSEKTEVITDKDGKEIVSRAEIMTQANIMEGRIYLGDIYDLTDAEKSDPLQVESYEIKRIDRVPLFRSTEQFVITVYL